MEYDIDVERRVRYKKMMPGELARDAGLTLKEENQRGMHKCIDRFHTELQTRLKAIKDVADMFEAVQIKSLITASEEELNISVPKLTNFYDEISKEEIVMEIPRLRRHLRAAEMDLEDVKDWSVLKMLEFIAEWDFIETLPNLSLSLKIFLTICVSVASCERSFSKLNLIKTYLRSTMEQSRLSSLSILSIENELVKDIDFDEVINKFAGLKARRVKL